MREASRPWVRLPRLLASLEGITLRAEAPIRRLVSSNRLNPLPHAGTISVFLFLVVVLSGLYITLFFEFGFEASYRSVAKLEDHLIQRAVRAIHRYSSAGLVLTTVVHGWRSLVMTRFTGPRRWRWMTGLFALLVVWLAGVTGYWLIWDRRAQTLNEVMYGLLDAGAVGVRFLVDQLVAPSGSGWPLLLAIWFLHLLLTVLIGWLLWRHLRFTRHRWFPPRFWMWTVAGGLTAVSIAFPAGMLPPADVSRLPSEIPLDVLVMFLLPALGVWSPWVVVGVGTGLLALGVALPWLLRRSDPPIVEIIDDQCTGCELCVIDCPYLALGMVERHGTVPLAVVDPGRCVGCGICLGSCAFDAMQLPGYDAADPPTGGSVTIVCERHLQQAVGRWSDTRLVPVACAGMLRPQTAADLLEDGATGVHVVGCPPADCLYGSGNLVAAQRLAGQRRPRLPRAWSGRPSADWIAPTELRRVAASPGGHPEADPDSIPADRRRAGAAALVLASVLVVQIATAVPYGKPGTGAEVAVVVDHVPGARLVGQAAPTGSPGVLPEVVVEVDGAPVARRPVHRSGGASVAFVRVPVDPAAASVRVLLTEGEPATLLFDGPADLAPGRRYLIEARDVPPPADVEEGRRLFTSSGVGANLGCSTCHSTEPARVLVGPSLAGIARAAGERVAGLDAEAYLRQSILEPEAFVVDGYRPGQMPAYADRIAPADLDDLVAYLMTLTEEEG